MFPRMCVEDVPFLWEVYERVSFGVRKGNGLDFGTEHLRMKRF